MKLSRILSALPEARLSRGSEKMEITGIADDSRKVGPGCLFVAIRGTRTDGHAHARDAADRGAAAVITEKALNLPVVAEVKVPDSSRALARVASCYYGYPCDELTVIGITGTNGKTTVSLLVKGLLEGAGQSTGLIGTLRYEIAGRILPAPNTTPGALQLQSHLRHMADAGMAACVMEVSSHALALGRVEECRFDVRVFTNLSRDHLDFHPSMEDYYQAKRRLFDDAYGKDDGVSVINVDDPWGQRLARELDGPVVTYGVREPADFSARDCISTMDGLSFSMETPDGTVDVKSPLCGDHNIVNILTAAAVGHGLKIPVDKVIRGITGVRAIPGRFEKVSGPGFSVVVDYAHTDDALRNLLGAVRKVCGGRIITVFGCGGDRDRGKRPLMGRVAAELSDIIIVTSDNPRTEDPAGIIDDILVGVREAKSPEARVIADRRAAIQAAIDEAGDRDVVVIAGKGHEDYQILGEKKIHFDDREEARRALDVRARRQIEKR